MGCPSAASLRRPPAPARTAYLRSVGGVAPLLHVGSSLAGLPGGAWHSSSHLLPHPGALGWTTGGALPARLPPQPATAPQGPGLGQIAQDTAGSFEPAAGASGDPELGVPRGGACRPVAMRFAPRDPACAAASVRRARLGTREALQAGHCLGRGCPKPPIADGRRRANGQCPEPRSGMTSSIGRPSRPCPIGPRTCGMRRPPARRAHGGG